LEKIAENETNRWRIELRRVLGNLPKDHESYLADVSQLQEEFFAEIIQSAEPHYAQHVARHPKTSLAEKRELASSVTRELKAMNLCIRNPISGEACHLTADAGGHGEASRFRLYTIGTENRKKSCFTHLPDLQLMQAPERFEPFAKSR
jgi:hypothetical protein